MSTQPPQGPDPAALLARLTAAASGLPDILRPGDVLVARVLAAVQGRATLLLRGARVDARTELPLQAGERLPLRVQELDGNRLILQVVDSPREVQAPASLTARITGSSGPLPLLAVALPLLTGGQPSEVLVRVDEEDEPRRQAARGSAGSLQVVVHWEGPSLGPVQVRFSLGAGPGQRGVLSVRLAVSGAEVRALVLDQAEELQQVLAALGWTGAEVGCQVTPAALLRAERQAALPLHLARLNLLG